MNDVANGMKSICNEIIKGHEDRRRLRKKLQKRREELVNNISTLREGFRKKERQVKKELDEARRVWNDMARTLKNKGGGLR